jgi:hypothetical protein
MPQPKRHHRLRPLKFGLRVPLGTQVVVLDLQQVWRDLIGERRALVCEVTPHLIKAGYSQNSVAQAFGLCSSTLSVWLNRFKEGGKSALVPKRQMPRPPRGAGPAFLAVIQRD